MGRSGWQRVVLFAALIAGALRAAAQVSSLPPEASDILRRGQVPEQALSLVVQEVTEPAPLVALNERKPVNPASLLKLATTYAALELLGPAYSWRTPVWLTGPVKDGVLHGSLVLQGRGDPTLVMERVWLLLRRVRSLGIVEIAGDIVLDRSAFAVPEGSPADFDAEPYRPYNVRPDALLLNHKAIALRLVPEPALGIARTEAEPPLAGVRIEPFVPLVNGPCNDWRAALKPDFSDPRRVTLTGRYPQTCGESVWQIAYADPHSYNARLIEALWVELGGRLKGKVADGPAPTDRPPVIELKSPSLAEVIRDINKYSNNVMAQQLYYTLGLERGGAGTPEAARSVLTQWMAERAGALAEGVVIDSGSGLSRETRISAALLARLLQMAWASPVMPELLASLPVSGLDGTLRRSAAPAGRAHLKTGSLRDAAGIAGVVLSGSGRRYVLVAIVNHPQVPNDVVRPLFDTLVRWVAADLQNTLPNR